MPSAQSYSVIGPVRHGFVSASEAGASNYEVSATSFKSRVMTWGLPGPKYDKLKITHMYESSSYDNSRSEVLGDEEGQRRHSHLPRPSCHNW
jgi:hypothetical protein